MIKVRIEGPPGSGKSLLACVLCWQLRMIGVNVDTPFSETSGMSLVGCCDQLRRLKTRIAIIDTEDREPIDD